MHQLSDIKIPVITIYGEEDDIIPAHQGKVLEQIFNYPCKIITGAGHSPLHEKDAETLSTAILRWHQEAQLRPPSASELHKDGNKERIVPVLKWEEFASSFSVEHTQQVIKEFYNEITADYIAYN